MKITYYGHNCLALEIKGKHILVDPFISGNELAKDKVDVDSLKADYILLTHAHQDHTLDAANIARRTGAIIVSNFEIATHYEKKGIEVHPMNHGGSWKFDFGNVKYVTAIHTSSFPDGSYGGQPGGFVIEGEHKNIYIAGDTALTMDMKLIPLRTKLDLAILPIGDNFTMGIDDAIIASDFVQCDKVLGVHYDTFGYIEIDHEEAKRKFYDANKDLMLFEIGEFIDL
ncbi:metal-dependent hydrolase [Aequorivita sp. KMM 9714]|uniref:metal-dependent hydrolase n=1 Tax=Aequorivita sp. KMM 9714 TaxID=2707173 RepID=UPI0013EC843F|nr:metal-dependent hydrolase [Aequorivita sp. KMM 9714]NGX84261.1 metal-dependent hydrolase [Aequorivita sp. KMM 9714]